MCILYKVSSQIKMYGRHMYENTLCNQTPPTNIILTKIALIDIFFYTFYIIFTFLHLHYIQDI